MDTNYDIINSESYFQLLSREELNEDDQKKIVAFQKHMADSDKYRDYLTGTHKDNKDSYEHGINQLAILEAMSGNKLTTYQEMALLQYDKQKTAVLKANEAKVRVLEKNDTSNGFINSFAVVLSVLATGILAGVIMFILK